MQQKMPLYFICILCFINCTKMKNKVLVGETNTTSSYFFADRFSSRIGYIKDNKIKMYQFKTKFFRNSKRNQIEEVCKWQEYKKGEFNLPDNEGILILQNNIGIINRNKIVFYHYDINDKWEVGNIDFTIPEENKGLFSLGDRGIAVINADNKINYHSFEGNWGVHDNFSLPDLKNGIISFPNMLDEKYLYKQRVIGVLNKREQKVDVYSYDKGSASWRLETEKTFSLPEKYEAIVTWDFYDRGSIHDRWQLPQGIAIGIVYNNSIDFYVYTNKWQHVPELYLSLDSVNTSKYKYY